MRKRLGHLTVYRGKRIILFFHDGSKLITRYIDKKGKFVITEAGKFSTKEVYNMGIYKPKE
jgi:hypothetical protein